jgi:hypothetical protein
VLQLRETHNVADKERILYRITQRGYEAGQQLLELAKTTDDNETRRLAIRRLGMLRLAGAARFLIESLQSDEHGTFSHCAAAGIEVTIKIATTNQPVLLLIVTFKSGLFAHHVLQVLFVFVADKLYQLGVEE